MKTSQLFWGFFLITIGLLYLLEKQIEFTINWHFVWNLWPVIIIFAGVALILKGKIVKSVVNILFGILTALLLFGLFHNTFDESGIYDKHQVSENISQNTYEVDYSHNISHVNLEFNGGAGKFFIDGTTNKLLRGFAEGKIEDYKVTNHQKDSIAYIKLNLKREGHFKFPKNKNKFELRLNEKPTWSMKFNLGAAKSTFDLRPFKIKNLILNTGASKTEIKLGNKTDLTYVNIDMGAASLTIYIPETSGCKVKGDMILMSKQMEDFDKTETGYYKTKNYDTAEKKIIIDIDGGISSFKIKRY